MGRLQEKSDWSGKSVYRSKEETKNGWEGSKNCSLLSYIDEVERELWWNCWNHTNIEEDDMGLYHACYQMEGQEQEIWRIDESGAEK